MSHLRLEFIDPNSIAGDPPIHDVLLCRQINVPLLEVTIGGVVSLDYLVQGHGQLLPAVLGLSTEFLDGRVNEDRVLRRGVDINHFFDWPGLLQSANPLFQMIVLVKTVTINTIKKC